MLTPFPASLVPFVSAGARVEQPVLSAAGTFALTEAIGLSALRDESSGARGSGVILAVEVVLKELCGGVLRCCAAEVEAEEASNEEVRATAEAPFCCIGETRAPRLRGDALVMDDPAGMVAVLPMV